MALEQAEIYGNIPEGSRIRSRCQWYCAGEKSTNFFFFNFEKLHGAQSQFHKIIVNDTKSQNTIKYKIK